VLSAKRGFTESCTFGSRRSFQLSVKTLFPVVSGSRYAKNLAELLSTLSRPAAVDNWWSANLTVISSSRETTRRPASPCASPTPNPTGACPALPSSTPPQPRHGLHQLRRLRHPLAGGGAPFFGAAVDANSGARLVLRSLTQAADADATRDARRSLLSRLAESAGDDSRRFATGSQGYMDAAVRRTWEVMYGMAQCTRDLPPAECSGCLTDHLGLGLASWKAT
jgi:hypothetical protein